MTGGGRGAQGMNLHLWSTYCVSSAVLGLEDSGVIKRNKDPCSCGACGLVEEGRQETRDTIRK